MIGLCGHGRPPGTCPYGLSRGCDGPAVTVEEALKRVYRQGFQDGFVTAHVDERGFPDEAAVLSKLSEVDVSEGWDAFRDIALATEGKS